MVTRMPSVPTVELILGERERLMRVARRLTRCEADAEDLVQDTLLRADRARDRFRPGTSMRAWTTTILRRVFLTGALRSRRRGVANDTDLGGPLAAAPGASWRPRTEADNEMGRLLERVEGPVKRAFDRVPEIYRLPFWLSVVEELSCAEIADRFGIPQGTAMSRIHRARESLRRDLVYQRVGGWRIAKGA